MLLPQFMVAHYWKANDVNDADKRTFKTKQYKNKFTYLQVHKKKHYKTLRILNIPLWVHVCVYVTNTNIMMKD